MTTTERILVRLIRRLMLILASVATVSKPSVARGILRTVTETRRVIDLMERAK